MVLLVLIPVGEVLLVLTVAGVAQQVFAWTAVALAFQVFLTGDVVAVVRKGVAVAYQVCGSVVAGVAVAEQVHLVVRLVVAEGSLLVWEVAAVEQALCLEETAAFADQLQYEVGQEMVKVVEWFAEQAVQENDFQPKKENNINTP